MGGTQTEHFGHEREKTRSFNLFRQVPHHCLTARGYLTLLSLVKAPQGRGKPTETTVKTLKDEKTSSASIIDLEHEYTCE